MRLSPLLLIPLYHPGSAGYTTFWLLRASGDRAAGPSCLLLSCETLSAARENVRPRGLAVFIYRFAVFFAD